VSKASFAYNDPNTAGTVKELNALTQSYTQSSGSVTCSSVYCHSNGYTTSAAPAHDYTYQTTPNWYGGTFAGDRCSNCHGNSPNTGIAGTEAHGMHVVSLHFKDIYSGTTGQISEAGTTGTGAAHGDTNVSTTINCHLCHNATVTVNYNDLNTNSSDGGSTACSACHGSSAPAMGTMVIDTTSTTHVNGTPNVVFANVTMSVRAQMRDDITTLDELNENWTRTNGYKAGATSHDAANKSLNVGSYASATKTCTNIACHNQDVAGTRSIQWTNTLPVDANLCYNCHRRLPR